MTKLTHEALLKAVREAGRDGRTFTCAAVRHQLGIAPRDKRELDRFHRRFRVFQRAAADQLEKVGKNAYRLKDDAPPPVLTEVAPAPEAARPSTPQASSSVTASEPTALAVGDVAALVALRSTPAEAPSGHSLRALALRLRRRVIAYLRARRARARLAATRIVRTLRQLRPRVSDLSARCNDQLEAFRARLFTVRGRTV